MARTEGRTNRVRSGAAIVACLAMAVVAAVVALRPQQPPKRLSPVGRAHEGAISAAAGDDALGPRTGEPAPTAEAAKASAIAYLRLSELVVGMDDAAAAEVQRAAATSSAADRLVVETLTKLAALRRSFPSGPVVLRVAPLAVRVKLDIPGLARADIWHVAVVSPPGGTAYEQWRTSHYELVWERDSWRVSAETSEDGPRPLSPALPPPASAAALEAALTGFEAAR